MATKWQRPINYDRIDREKVPLLVLFSYFFTRQSLPINNVKNDQIYVFSENTKTWQFPTYEL